MATATERHQFGERLRDLRRASDYSLDHLAARMNQAGQEVSSASIGAWERGEYLPRHRGTVHALDHILRTGGELAALLGYAPPTPDEPIEISASGVDLAELQRRDPEAYQQLMDQAAFLLERARRRRQ